MILLLAFTRNDIKCLNKKEQIFRDIHLMKIHLIIAIGREVEGQRRGRNEKILGRG